MPMKTSSGEEKVKAFKLLTECKEKKHYLVKISCGSLTLSFNYY